MVNVYVFGLDGAGKTSLVLAFNHLVMVNRVEGTPVVHGATNIGELLGFIQRLSRGGRGSDVLGKYEKLKSGVTEFVLPILSPKKVDLNFKILRGDFLSHLDTVKLESVDDIPSHVKSVLNEMGSDSSILVPVIDPVRYEVLSHETLLQSRVLTYTLVYLANHVVGSREFPPLVPVVTKADRFPDVLMDADGWLEEKDSLLYAHLKLYRDDISVLPVRVFDDSPRHIGEIYFPSGEWVCDDALGVLNRILAYV